MLDDVAPAQPDGDKLPVLLDLFAGANAPLTKAFMWCGWKAVTPIDLEIDPDFDVTEPSVQRALLRVLPEVAFITAAMSCSTKSRAREKPPGPRPLRDDRFPRGLPTLSGAELQRVELDNEASDFALALQQWGNEYGLGCLRENPLNSLHWKDPVECSLWLDGSWFDTPYDACVFMGARKKAQRLRHNIPEISMLPSLRCGHVHSQHEWSRTSSGFPTFAESEYTPSLVFTIAVASTAWAKKVGWACESIPRLPPIHVTGDVRGLLEFPPEFLRSDLMLVTALHLGLRPHESAERGVPRRKVAADFSDKVLPANHIYIGPGHFSHRWPVGDWTNPFQPGRDGTAFETVIRYMQWIQDQPTLLSQLHQLRGQTLVCDCPHSQLCHGDVLAAMIWEAFPPAKSRSTVGCPSRWVLAAASGTRVVSSMPISFCQEEVVSAFQSRCFSVTWDKFKFPLIEDLLLDPCFTAFRNWRQEHCLHQGLPAGPRVVSQCERPMFRMALGVQTGAGASGKAAPPLIPFGLGADGHFHAASAFQSLGTPFEQDPLVDDDLLFAASQSAAWYGRLRAERERVLRVLKELSYRWQPVTEYIRSFQPWEVAKATAGRHLAMIGLLSILVDWPDSTFLHNLLTGFPSVGFSPHVASYTSQPATWIPLDELWDSSLVDAARILRHLRPGPLDPEIVKAGDKDESLGFCSEPFSWEHLLNLDRPFRLIRRFCIQQGDKCRVIDDANDGGQSALSSDANKLDLCTAIQPGIHVRLLATALWEQYAPWDARFDPFETGGEDLPNAYRHVPMVPEDSWASIVTYWDPSRAAPCFRRYFGLLFGLPNAVCSFNRFPRMLQCFFRRLGFCMASMYFDDLTVQDLQSNKGSSQQFCINLASILGSAFSEEKHQPMQASADFLGLCHNVGDCHTQQGVTFWVRDRLLVKVNGYISDALHSGTLRPGVASKLFGCLTFLAQGCWGKVGRSGLQPLQDRQYSMDRDNSLTPELLRSFSFISDFLSLRPQRCYPLDISTAPRFIIASDAAQDEPRQGSAGALLLFPSGFRAALVLRVDSRMFDLWDSQSAKIAQLELCVIVMTIASMASELRGHHCLWFVDNIASLMSLIRGRSSTLELDAMTGIVHAMLCGLQCMIYWEWVASADNWSDGVSRNGSADPWLRRHSFTPFMVDPLLLLFQLSPSFIIRIFSFL